MCTFCPFFPLVMCGLKITGPTLKYGSYKWLYALGGLLLGVCEQVQFISDHGANPVCAF